MADLSLGSRITTEAELRALLGAPSPIAAKKDRYALDELDRQWLASSSFCLISTSHADGTCDVSPKGDPPGFALVLDPVTIAIPERPGNKRADGYRNVLSNPHVGILFIIPGRTDTLRINGRATLVTDAPFFDQMIVNGHRPIMALVAHIEQLFYHCSKAFMRSHLWDYEAWNPGEAPTRVQIVKQLERPDTPIEELERYYGAAYSQGLYQDL